MTFMQFSNPENQFQHNSLRRSDRKKTKKVFKDDFLIPNPFKGKSKKHRSLRLPQNLDCQIKKIQFLTQRTLAMLNYGKQQFSFQMLNEMKQAVNQQQTKLSEFLQIKLKVEKNFGQLKFPTISTKSHRSHAQKQNTPKTQQNTSILNQPHDYLFQKQALGISTAQQLYYSLSSSSIDEQSQISAFDSCNIFSQINQPCCLRKQSYKLLSDNYQNNQLILSIDHINMNWHKDQHILDQQYNE